MKTIKTILISLLLSTQVSKAQMVTTNIQSLLLNKNWSSQPNSNKGVQFLFEENQLFVKTNGKPLGNSYYYIIDSDSSSISAPFDDSKIGTISSGNYIKTKGLCYTIEFYHSLKRFRIRPSNSPKWQNYYLLD